MRLRRRVLPRWGLGARRRHAGERHLDVGTDPPPPEHGARRRALLPLARLPVGDLVHRLRLLQRSELARARLRLDALRRHLDDVRAAAAAGLSDPGAEASNVSLACPAVGWCVAVGDYQTPVSGQYSAFVDTLSGGSWSTMQAPAPVGAPVDDHLNLQAVACYSTTSCAAVGTYDSSTPRGLAGVADRDHLVGGGRPRAGRRQRQSRARLLRRVVPGAVGLRGGRRLQRHQRLLPQHRRDAVRRHLDRHRPGVSPRRHRPRGEQEPRRRPERHLVPDRPVVRGGGYLLEHLGPGLPAGGRHLHRRIVDGPVGARPGARRQPGLPRTTCRAPGPARAWPPAASPTMPATPTAS